MDIIVANVSVEVCGALVISVLFEKLFAIAYHALEFLNDDLHKLHLDFMTEKKIAVITRYSTGDG